MNQKKPLQAIRTKAQTLRSSTSKIKPSSSKSPNNMMSKTLNQVWNHSIKETSVEQEHNEELGEAREKRSKIEALKELMKAQLSKSDSGEPKAAQSSKISTDLTVPGYSRDQLDLNSKEDLIHIEEIKNPPLQNKPIKPKRHTSACNFQKLASDRKLSEGSSRASNLVPRGNLPDSLDMPRSREGTSSNSNRFEVHQPQVAGYPMRRVQTQADKLTKNIELKVCVVELDGKKVSKSSLAKIAWRKSFQETPAPEASKIEIPEHQDVELEIYAGGRGEPLKKFSGVSCKPAFSEKPYCDMVIVDVSQHRHLVKVDRKESALFNEPDINDSSPISSTEEKVIRKEWNCVVLFDETQQPMEALIEIVKGSGSESAEVHNGFLLESDEQFSHVLVKTTSNGRIYFKDDRANQSRILIYERSFIEVGPEKVHCYLITTEKDIMESKKNKPVHMEYLCVTSDNELLVEPYGYLEGEYAELCLSDGSRYLGQLYFEKLQDMHNTSEPMFVVKLKTSNSKHFTVNLKPTLPHNTLETRLNHLCIPLLNKYQEMRSSKTPVSKTPKLKKNSVDGNAVDQNSEFPALHPSQGKPSLPKISVRDKRGATVLIYLNEEDSIDSSDLSDSFESDCFYPDDEIYRVEVNGKLHVPIFKKFRNAATAKLQTTDQKVLSVHQAIPPQGGPDPRRSSRGRHRKEQNRLRRPQEIHRALVRLSEPGFVPGHRAARKREGGKFQL